MTTITGEQKLLALIVHLSYLLAGIGFIFAPLVIYLVKKDDPFVHDHARQALIAHLVVLAISSSIGLLCLLLIGILLLPVLVIVWLILVVTSFIAAIRALDGQLYRYPFIQKLISKMD